MFTQHTVDNAPEASAKTMKTIEKNMGFLPNLFGYLAASPAATNAYAQLNQLLADSSIGGKQLQIALLAISVENRCRFCVAAHSAGATKGGVDADTIEAIRNNRLPEDKESAALVKFVRQVVKERGWVGEAAVQEFLDAGFGQEQVMDLLTAVAMKTLSNYSNHLSDPTINPELEKFDWKPAS